MEFLCNLIARFLYSKTQKIEFTGRRIDCRENCWGHSCSIVPAERKVVETGGEIEWHYPCVGHLYPKPRPGDQLILRGKADEIFQFVQVEHSDKPTDKFNGTVVCINQLWREETNPERRSVTNFVRNFISPFLRKKPEPAEFTGRRIDCRKNFWGHSCILYCERVKVVETGGEIEWHYPCAGWLSPKPRPGDQLIIRSNRGDALFRFIEVRYPGNPADMFFGTVVFVDLLCNFGKPDQIDESFQVAESALIAIEGRTPESHPDQWARGNGHHSE